MLFSYFIDVLEQRGRKEAKEALKAKMTKSVCANQSTLKFYWEQLTAS
jgi:hypothetical protein